MVLFHLQWALKIPVEGVFSKIVEQFYLSVLLFFVISAFTLSHSARVAPSRYFGYLTKRFFRIAPLFYLLVFAACIVPRNVPETKAILANLTFTFNFFPGLEQSLVPAGWSVGVEMLFYLVFPVMLLALRNPLSAFVGFGIAVILSVISWKLLGSVKNTSGDFAYYFVGSNLASFVAGIWAYRTFERANDSVVSKYKKVFPIACIVVLAFVFIDPIKFHESIPGLFFSLLGFGFALLCLWQAWSPSRVLLSAPFQWLGDRSYSLYLLHSLVLYFGDRFFGNYLNAAGLSAGYLYLVGAAATIPAIFVCAEMSYRLIEVPAIRLGSRIAARINASGETGVD